MPEAWSPNNPTYGTCAITALVVNDLFGGKIKKVKVGNITHFYNFIDGQNIDLTAEQFGNIIPKYQNAETTTREDVLKSIDTQKRYDLLKSRLQQPDN